jgi:hypothetical protein
MRDFYETFGTDKVFYKTWICSADKWVWCSWMLLEDSLTQQCWIEISRAVLRVGRRNNSFEYSY